MAENVAVEYLEEPWMVSNHCKGVSQNHQRLLNPHRIVYQIPEPLQSYKVIHAKCFWQFENSF